MVVAPSADLLSRSSSPVNECPYIRRTSDIRDLAVTFSNPKISAVILPDFAPQLDDRCLDRLGKIKETAGSTDPCLAGSVLTIQNVRDVNNALPNLEGPDEVAEIWQKQRDALLFISEEWCSVFTNKHLAFCFAAARLGNTKFNKPHRDELTYILALNLKGEGTQFRDGEDKLLYSAPESSLSSFNGNQMHSAPYSFGSMDWRCSAFWHVRLLASEAPPYVREIRDMLRRIGSRLR